MVALHQKELRDLFTMALYPDPADGLVIEAERLRAWTDALVRRVGTPPDIAADVAELLLAADLRGIASHGTARQTGTAISVLRNANHYGIAGWYAMRVARQGLIGLSLTNTSPIVAPTRARTSLLGTNPIAFAAPAGRFGMLVLDMATSTVPRGRIEVAARRGETIPAGWAIAPDGSAATTPELALEGALQPLGGSEETGGYKGYGLALLVEVLTGILGDAAFGPDIVGLFSTEGRSNLGQLFMAIDPSALDHVSSFERRLERLLDLLTHAPCIPDAPGPVLYPGQPEAERAEKQAREGIVIDREHHDSLVALGERQGVAFPAARAIG